LQVVDAPFQDQLRWTSTEGYAHEGPRSVSAARRPQFVVSVFNDIGLSSDTILEAEKTVQQVYQQTGLAIVWQNCSPKSGPEFGNCSHRIDGRHLVLHIVHAFSTLAADVCGVAFLDADGFGTYCDLSNDRIVELHRRTRAGESRILGVVAAHELGHLLLGSHPHSSTGIMRPQMLERDFGGKELGSTNFSRQPAQTILQRLAVTVSKQEAAVIASGGNEPVGRGRES
jgi:hypothetical protein